MAILECAPNGYFSRTGGQVIRCPKCRELVRAIYLFQSSKEEISE